MEQGGDVVRMVGEVIRDFFQRHRFRVGMDELDDPPGEGVRSGVRFLQAITPCNMHEQR